jgi:hypothetical protein
MSRLPVPGQDANTWGDILNDFLSNAHDSAGNIKPNSIDTAQLSSSLQAKIAKATTSVQTINGEAPVNGDISIAAGAQGPQGTQGAVGVQGIAGTDGQSVTVTLVAAADWPPPADSNPLHWYVKVP